MSILVAKDEFSPRDLNHFYPNAYVAANFVLYTTTQAPTTAPITSSTSAAPSTTTGTTNSTPAATTPTTTPYVLVSEFAVCANVSYKGMVGELKEIKCANGTFGR